MKRFSLLRILSKCLSPRLGLQAAALAAALVGSAQGSPLNPGGPQLPAGRKMAVQDTLALAALDAYKLLNTHVGLGAGGTLYAGEYTWLESRTVNCTNAAGCHIGHDSMVQLNTTGNWAICLSVDNAYTTCAYQGHLSHTGSYVVGNAKGWSDRVSQGLHTVMTEVYTEVPSLLGRWQTDHRIYKP